MYAPSILTRSPSTLTVRLERFSTQVLNNPSHEETLATWRQLENQLPLEYQTRILLAWNKHLAGVNDHNDIGTTVDEIIRELRS